MPVHVFCCFSISGFPHIKRLQKFRKNQKKNQRTGTFRNHLGGARGPPPGTQVPWWCALGVGRVRGAPGSLVDPLAAPLRLYIPPAEEIPNIQVLFPISSLYRRRRRFKIGAARRRYPGTLPEGGITSGSPSISMDASQMCREYSWTMGP